MDFNVLGSIFEKLAPLSAITDREGKILWTSSSLEGLVSLDEKGMEEILGLERGGLWNLPEGKEIEIFLKDSDYLARTFKAGEYIFIEFQEIGDYKDPG